MKQGSAPNFCPPVEEGAVYEFQDEKGDIVSLEFLGLVLHNERSYGFFFEIDDENPALASGEVLILEVTSLDEEGQPAEFELITDMAIAAEMYEVFKEATKDLYDFE